MSKKLAVVGSPISHSKSPALHSAAYRTLGDNFEYSKIEIVKNHLMQFVESLDSDWHGLSVTAPLKEEALRLAAEVDATAKISGVANTLLRSDKGWSAFNTDVYGITKSLDVEGINGVKLVSVLGTGATARSAILAVAESFPDAKLLIAGRNKSAIGSLANFAKQNGLSKTKASSINSALGKSDLVISTLPAFQLNTYVEKLKKSWFAKPRGILFDIAYEPWPSAAAQVWMQSNLRVISGIQMLLWQAVAQVRIFSTGQVTEPLPNEAAVVLAMKDSIGLL